MENNVLTGYPHIDNVHKAYFGEKGKEQIDVNKTMYQYLMEKTAKYDGTAISFYGREISFTEFKRNIQLYPKVP